MEEDVGDLIPGLDVDLNEHVFLGAIDSSGHGHDGLVIGGMQTLVVANERRVPGEVAVELDEGFDFRGKPAFWVVRCGGRDVGDERVGFLLNPVAAPVDVRRAHEQEQRQAHDGQHENGQQPGGRARWPAAFGDDADGDNLDAIIQDEQGKLPCREINIHAHICLPHRVEIRNVEISNEWHMV